MRRVHVLGFAVTVFGICAGTACTDPEFRTVAMPAITPVAVQPAPPVLGIAHDEDGSVSIFDTSKQQVVATIKIAEKVGVIAISADGRQLFASIPDGIAVVDVDARRVVRTIARPGVRSALVAAKDVLYVVEEATNEHNRVAAMDIRDGSIKAERLIRTLTGRADISGDGHRLYIAHHFYTGIITSLRTSDLGFTGETRHEDGARGIRLSPDNRRIFVPNGMRSPGRLDVIDSTSLKPHATIELTSEPLDVAIAPDGARAYLPLLAEEQVAVVDLEAMKVERTIAVAAYARQIALSPSGDRAFVLHDRDGVLTAIDLKTSAVSTIRLDRNGDTFAIPPRLPR